MNSLALLLFLVLLASAGLFLIAARLTAQRRATSSRSFIATTQRWYVVYAWAICFLLCGLGIAPYMGLLSPHGSPQLTPIQQRSIVHEGYYAAVGSEMRFTSDAQDEAFRHGALAEDEFLALRPNTTVGQSSIDRWFLKYDLRSQPLRFNGKVQNIPDSWWLSPGDSLIIVRQVQDSAYFMAFRWKTDTNWLGKPTNEFIYGDGVRIGNNYVYRNRDVLLTRRIYREARNLGVMLRLAPSSFTDVVRTNDFDPAWWDVLRSITLIRERKNNINPDSSAMGVLIADSLFQGSPRRTRPLQVELYKNTERLERIPVLEDSIEVAPNTHISYGYGYRNALVFAALEDSLYKDDRLDYIARLNFRLPPSWNLPPDPDTTFIITSSTAYIPLDGYVFNTVGQRHPFYAKASLNPTHNALEVNDGKESRAFALDEAVALGDADQGVVLALQARRAPSLAVPFIGMALPSGNRAGLWAVLFLLGLTVFFSILVGTEQHERIKLDLAWTLIWGMVLTLLMVRLLLSYRLALLPPANATPDEVANVFNKSFHVSFWAMVMLPFLLLVMRLVLHSRWERSRRWRRFKKKMGDWKIWTMAQQLAQKVGALKARIAAFLRKYDRVLLPVVSCLLLVGLSTLLTIKFKLNIWAVVIVTVLIVLVSAKFVSLERLRRYRDAFVRQWPLLLPFIWIGLGMAIGSNEAIGPVRINIGTHILIILGLVLSLARIMPTPTTADKVVMSLLVLGAVGGCIVGVGDRGFFIYGISLGFFLVLLWLWKYRAKARRTRGNQLWPKVWALLRSRHILLVLPVLFPLLLFTVPRTLPGTPLVGPQGNVYYRIVSAIDTQEDVLMNRGEIDNVNIDMLLRNSHQHWQMLLYAAEGALAPSGYGQASLSDRGMTYPTSITDCAFSMYLLSENGKWVAFLYLMLHVTLCAACLYGGWFMERTYQYRGTALFAIGAFFACNALYMANANLGTIFFTGQNIPLLGLYSWSDMMQTAFLLCCATVLLFKGMKSGAVDTAQQAMRDHAPLLRFGQVFLGVALAIPLLLLAHMATFNPDHREDHDFDRALFQEVGKRQWTYNEDTGALEASGFEELAEIEQLSKTQFESRANKFEENGGLYYIVPVTDPNTNEQGFEVRVNRFYFRLRSPFRSQIRWRGTVFARSDDTEPTMSALGRQFRVRLGSDPNFRSINLFTGDPVDATSGVVFLDRNNNAIADLERQGDSLSLAALGSTWTVFHEGNRIRAGDPETWLKPLDVIVLEQRTSAGLDRQNLIYLGTPPPVLGAAMWRNGKLQHIYPEGDVFPAVFTMMKTGDRAIALAAENPTAPPEPAPPDTTAQPDTTGLSDTIDQRTLAVLRDTTSLPLSIYIPLHRKLQTTLKEYALDTPPFNDDDPIKTNILALTVMNAHSGEVLALPAWPVPDPNADDFEERVAGATPAQQRRLLRNHNLVRHIIGSTTKPILFTAVAAQLWEQNYDVAQLAYSNQPNWNNLKLSPNQDRPAHPHWNLAGIPLEQWWDCDGSESPIDARGYLVRSRNYYAAMTGMLGMLINPADINKVLQRGGSGVTYRGQPYSLNLNASIESPFTLNDIGTARATRTNRNIANTLLFTGLPELFNVYLSGGDNLDPSTSVDSLALTGMATQYLPLFAGADATRNLYLDDIIPEPIIMRPSAWEGRVRADLVSFFLGGGINRWNNVMMAEAGARLATGRKVEATLQQRPKSTDIETLFDDLPPPMSIPSWRNNHIISPMEGAGREPGGTTVTIVNALGSAASGYRLLFKTGTLQEGGQRERRSELLLFVIGQWDAAQGRFVPGKTLSAFLYMQKSRTATGAWKRNVLGPRLIRDMIDYLNEDA